MTQFVARIWHGLWKAYSLQEEEVLVKTFWKQ
jgi:hypothetical protein